MNRSTFFQFRKHTNLDLTPNGYILVFRILGYGLTIKRHDGYLTFSMRNGYKKYLLIGNLIVILHTHQRDNSYEYMATMPQMSRTGATNRNRIL